MNEAPDTMKSARRLALNNALVYIGDLFTLKVTSPTMLRYGAGFFLLFAIVAAVVNVPWSLTFMRPRMSGPGVSVSHIAAPRIPDRWPSVTPHENPWPKPDYWQHGYTFGYRHVHARADAGDPERDDFVMIVQHLGWPLPVIEIKNMSWDLNNPALMGPKSDPAPSLVIKGLILNPILLAGMLWMLTVFPWITIRAIHRSVRLNRNQCLECGRFTGAHLPCTRCSAQIGTE